MEASRHSSGRRWARTLIRLLLPTSIAALYWNNFRWMWRRWFPGWGRSDLGLYRRIVEGESYYTHGPLTALVALVILVLLIRHTRIALRPKPRLGVCVLVLSLLIHLSGSFARISFVSAFSLIGVLTGLVLMLWGAEALRRCWFALAMLLFMIPLPEVTIAELNFRLKMFAADWGVRLVNLLGVVAVRSGNQAYLEGGRSLVIANVCNGLRTLISLMAFGALYAYVCRLRGLYRVVLFMLSLPVAVVSNSVRVAGLIVAAELFGVEAATGWLHELSGVMLFALALGMMFGLEKLILQIQRLLSRLRPEPLFHRVRRGPGDEDQWRHLSGALTGRVAGLATAVLLLGAGITWHLNRTGSSAWSTMALGKILPKELYVNGHRFQGYDLPLDKRTLTALESPSYLYRRYMDPRGNHPPLDSCLIFSGDNRRGIHPPDLCLEGGGQNVIAKADVTVPAPPGGQDVPCRELIVQAPDRRYYFLYTYKCGGRYTRSFWRQQFVIFSSGLLSRNAAGALIRVSTPIPPEQLDKARQNAFAMLQETLHHLDKVLR